MKLLNEKLHLLKQKIEKNEKITIAIFGLLDAICLTIWCLWQTLSYDLLSLVVMLRR